MIRSFLAILALVLFLLFGIPWLGILWIYGKFNKEKADLLTYHSVQKILNLIWHISGVRPIVQGLERVPTDRRVLYIGNHLSIFDVVLTYSMMPGVTGYISKDVLKKVPLLKTWMDRTYCLFLDRSDIKAGMKTILTAIDYVKKDQASIFIFPEGTRSTTGELQEFKGGSFKIATRTGCPIVPVAITNTSKIFEDHKPFIRGTKVVITFCEPIYLDKLEPEKKKHIAEYAREIIQKQKEEDKKLL